MEKDKSRGLKHIKDKKKYKGNSVKIAKCVPVKSKTNLGSNWDRYDSGEENEQEHKLSRSTDFSLLSSVPISTGSHFKFKNEKYEEESSFEKVNLFCLDLDILHRSILTVPFYERLDIPRKYFKGHEIDTMDKEAQKHLSTYYEFIQSTNSQDCLTSESTAIDDLSEKLQDIPSLISSDKEDSILELIDNFDINNESSEGIADIKINVAENSKQDLEQWLEDILED